MKQLSELKSYDKIAVMGGTFDPIHHGHLVAAEAVRQEFGVDRVLFIPTGQPPHRETNPMYNEHRYLMCVLATVNNQDFEVSRMEIDREGTTYTIDTIKELHNVCKKDCKIYFITGADAVEEILTWKNPKELLELCEFVACTRPGYDKTGLQKKINELNDNFKARIHFLEIPALSISSTDIRNRLIAGKTIKYLVPQAVEQYIYKFGLYTDDSSNTPQIMEINKKIHSLLTPKRFRHTQGVAEEAQKLAKLYGEDEYKAYIAGLLHDCAKCFTPHEQLQLCEKYSVEMDPVLYEQPALTHSFLGAKMAERDFGITDDDILNAIKYHTTGRAGMSLLEKIVYIADCIEPNREYYSGLKEIRELAYIDIDKAMKFALKNTLEYNTAKGRVIHPLSYEALYDFEEEE